MHVLRYAESVKGYHLWYLETTTQEMYHQYRHYFQWTKI